MNKETVEYLQSELNSLLFLVQFRDGLLKDGAEEAPIDTTETTIMELKDDIIFRIEQL